MSTIGWVLLAALGCLSGGLAWLWRAADGSRRALEASLEEAEGAREELRNKLLREADGRKRQSEELAELRRKADKARRRSARGEKGSGDRPVGTATRMADLEERLTLVERERDRARAECARLESEALRREAEFAAARRAAESAAVAAEKKPIPAAPPAVSDSSLVEGLEARVTELGAALEAAQQNEARLRKRMTNQEQLYASIRAELEVKKDRLRAQEERIHRLEAFRVAIAD
jgi:chromosome segregation ATPase